MSIFCCLRAHFIRPAAGPAFILPDAFFTPAVLENEYQMIKAGHPDFLNLVSENGLVELRQAQRSGGVFHKNILRHLLRMAVRLTHRQIGAAIPGCFCPGNLASVIFAAFVADNHLCKYAVLRRVALNAISLTIPLPERTGLCKVSGEMMAGCVPSA